MQSFSACPRRWHYDKVEHAPKERTGVARVFGSAVHDALAQVNEAALHGERIDADAAFVATWKRSVAETEAPLYLGKDDPGELLAKGRALIAAYTPPPGIVGVEQPFTIELDPDLPPVTGRIDLIRRTETGELVIADLKTSASRVLAETAAVEAQLGLYDQAYPAAHHEVVVLAKLKTPIVTIQCIAPWSRERLVRNYGEVHDAMCVGIRFASRGWHCESCSYANRCQADG